MKHKPTFSKIREAATLRLNEGFDFQSPNQYHEQIKKLLSKANIVSEIKSVEKLGGSSNHNFKVNLKDDTALFVRIADTESSKFTNRRAEKINDNKASEARINPKTIFFELPSGSKISEYIPSSEKPSLSECVDVVRNLHGSGLKFTNHSTIFDEIDKLGRFVEEDAEYTNILKSHRADFAHVKKVPCHRDLIGGNFIKSNGGSVFIIDWEHSAMDDPMVDVASLAINTENLNIKVLLNYYFGGKVPQDAYKRVLLYESALCMWICLFLKSRNVYLNIAETYKRDSAYLLKQYDNL